MTCSRWWIVVGSARSSATDISDPQLGKRPLERLGEPGTGVTGPRHSLDLGALGLERLLFEHRDRLLVDRLAAVVAPVAQRRDRHLGDLLARRAHAHAQLPEVVVDERAGGGTRGRGNRRRRWRGRRGTRANGRRRTLTLRGRGRIGTRRRRGVRRRRRRRGAGRRGWWRGTGRRGRGRR